FTNYVRIKVFTERGKESQSKIDIEYPSEYKVKDVAARTIKTDGSIIDLKKEDIHERTIAKASGGKLKAVAFAMPCVEPGVIVEYRWREIHSNDDANYVGLQFQRDIPVRNVTYLVRPYSGPYPSAMGYKTFDLPNDVKFEKVKNGFYQVSLTNVAAFRE